MKIILRFLICICLVSEHIYAWELQQNITCKNSFSLKTDQSYWCIPSHYDLERINQDRIALVSSNLEAVISFHFSKKILEGDKEYEKFVNKIKLRGEMVWVYRSTIDPSFVVHTWIIEIVPNELYIVLKSPNEAELSELFNEIMDSNKNNNWDKNKLI